MIPKPGAASEAWDPFDCDRYCRGEGGQWDPLERAARGCTRDDLPPVEWDVSADRLGHYLGRPADRSLEGQVFGSWEEPSEDFEEGCPGGWRRTAFVDSVVRHSRKRTKDGNRVGNPFFDRIEDELLLAAVLCFEAQEDACVSYFERAQAEQRRAELERQRREARQGR